MSAGQTDEIMDGDGYRGNRWQFVEIQGRCLWTTSKGIAYKWFRRWYNCRIWQWRWDLRKRIHRANEWGKDVDGGWVGSGDCFVRRHRDHWVVIWQSEPPAWNISLSCNDMEARDSVGWSGMWHWSSFAGKQWKLAGRASIRTNCGIGTWRRNGYWTRRTRGSRRTRRTGRSRGSR